MSREISLNDKYIPLFQNESRYFVVTGGRGSGKSFGVTLRLLSLTYERGEKILFTRFTMISAATSIIPEFIEKIDLMGKQEDFRITKDEIMNLTTGSSIIFKGIRTSSGNQTAALKSLNDITAFVVDEAEELTDEETFDKIDLSVRVKGKQNRVILILNPTTKEHWIYGRFFRNALVKDGVNGIKGNTTYIHTTYKDNKANLEPSFLQRVLEIKRRNPNKYMHQILGGWKEKAEGTIISNWRVGNFIQTELTCYGQDFGFSADLTTLVKISVDKQAGKVWVKEIFGKAHMSTTEIAIPDHSGKNPENLSKFRPTPPRYPDISVPLPTPGTKPGPESTLACDSLPGDALKILFEAMRVPIRPVTLFWASHWRRAPPSQGPMGPGPFQPKPSPYGPS